MIGDIIDSVLSDYNQMLDETSGQKIQDIRLLQLRNFYEFLVENKMILDNYYEVYNNHNFKDTGRDFINTVLKFIAVEKEVHEGILEDIDSSPVVSGMSKSSVAGSHLNIISICEEIESFFMSESNKDMFIDYYEESKLKRQAV